MPSQFHPDNQPLNPPPQAPKPQNIIIEDDDCENLFQTLQTLQTHSYPPPCQPLPNPSNPSLPSAYLCFVCSDLMGQQFLRLGLDAEIKGCGGCGWAYHALCVNKFVRNREAKCPNCAIRNLDPFDQVKEVLMTPRVVWEKQLQNFEFQITED